MRYDEEVTVGPDGTRMVRLVCTGDTVFTYGLLPVPGGTERDYARNPDWASRISWDRLVTPRLTWLLRCCARTAARFEAAWGGLVGSGDPGRGAGGRG